MTPRGLLILTGITAAIGAAALIDVSLTERSERGDEHPIQAFAGLAQKSAGAAKIAIVAANSKVTLDRDDKGEWHVAELANYPAKPDSVRRLMIDLETMDLLEKRSSREEAQEAMGLKPPDKGGPAVSVTVTDKSGAVLASVLQGKVRDYGTGAERGTLYVRLPGEANSWYARSSLQAATDPTAWVSKQIMEIARNRIAEAIARPGAADKVIARRRDPDALDFTVDNLPRGAELSSPGAANGFGSAITWLSFDDVKPRAAADLSGAETVTYRTFDGLMLTFRIRRDKDHAWFTVDAAAQPADKGLGDKHPDLKSEDDVRKEADALNAALAPWAFQISSAKADDMTPTMDKLLKKPEPSKPKDKSAAKR
jgi:hypothetical protein